jgi:hypothetical protein
MVIKEQNCHENQINKPELIFFIFIFINITATRIYIIFNLK